MSTVSIRSLQIVKNCSQQESVYVFNLNFCSSVLVSQLILIVVISIQLNECWISGHTMPVQLTTLYSKNQFKLTQYSAVKSKQTRLPWNAKNKTKTLSKAQFPPEAETCLEHYQQNQTPVWKTCGRTRHLSGTLSGL